MKLSDFNLLVSGFAVGVALGAFKLEMYAAAAFMAVMAVLNFWFYWSKR